MSENNDTQNEIYGVKLSKQFFYPQKFDKYEEIVFNHQKDIKTIIEKDLRNKFIKSSAEQSLDYEKMKIGRESKIVIRDNKNKKNYFIKFGDKDCFDFPNMIKIGNDTKKGMLKLKNLTDNILSTDKKPSLISNIELIKYKMFNSKKHFLTFIASKSESPIGTNDYYEIFKNNNEGVNIINYIRASFVSLLGFNDGGMSNLIQINDNVQIIDLRKNSEINTDLDYALFNYDNNILSYIVTCNTDTFTAISDFNKRQGLYLLIKFIDARNRIYNELLNEQSKTNDNKIEFVIFFIFVNEQTLGSYMMSMEPESNVKKQYISLFNFLNKHIDIIITEYQKMLKQAFQLEPDINNAYYIKSLAKTLKDIYCVANYLKDNCTFNNNNCNEYKNNDFANWLKQTFTDFDDNYELYNNFKKKAELADLIYKINKNKDADTRKVKETSANCNEINTYINRTSNQDNNNNENKKLFIKKLFASYLKVAHHKYAEMIEDNNIIAFYNTIFPFNNQESPIEFINNLNTEEREELQQQVQSIMMERIKDYIIDVNKIDTYNKNNKNNKNFKMLNKRYNRLVVGMTLEEIAKSEEIENNIINKLQSNLILQSSDNRQIIIDNNTDIDIMERIKTRTESYIQAISEYIVVNNKLTDIQNKNNIEHKQELNGNNIGSNNIDQKTLNIIRNYALLKAVKDFLDANGMNYDNDNNIQKSNDDNVMEINNLVNNENNKEQQEKLKCEVITNILDSIYNDNSINNNHNLISRWNSWHMGDGIKKIKKKYKVLDNTLKLLEDDLIEKLKKKNINNNEIGSYYITVGCCCNNIKKIQFFTSKNKLYQILQQVKQEMNKNNDDKKKMIF